MAGPLLVLLGPSPWEGPFVAALAHPASGIAIARRCLDTADLLASASAGLGAAALVGADAPRLDADVLARLGTLGIPVVGLAAAGDAEAVLRLTRWGAVAVVEADPADLGAAVRGLVAAVRAAGAPAPAAEDLEAGEPQGRGRVVTVWGPPGAPGRTSVAVALADEASRLGSSVLLVDADTWAPSVPVVLGLVDDGPGLASACRRALAGTLDVDALASVVRELRPGLLVLPGIPRAGRWTEVRGAALAEVLAVARGLADLVVVDVGAPIESDEELVFDTQAPRRNAAALVALEDADVVVAVGSAEPVGLVRLVAGLAELRDAVRGADVRVVLTRVRPSSLGPRPGPAAAEAISRHAGVDQVLLVPDDRPAYDAALRDGRTLAESAPSSPARHALRGLAVEVLRDVGLREPAVLVAGGGRR
jgi:MinD-like ATPase involved in chromosome partitioning or flagellar assembly